MTRIILLDRFKEFCEASTKDLIMPVSLQKGDAEQQYRAAEVHSMRLPDSKAAKKKVPYILNQIIMGRDVQESGNRSEANAVMRTICCVYNENEEEGALMLLNLMERLRIALLETRIIGKQFEVDLQAGIESLIYPEDTAPYYSGEMMTTWQIPEIERKDSLTWQKMKQFPMTK